MRLVFILLKKEIKDIFFSKTAVLFFILTSFVIGNSFVMAVDLYSKASKTAIGNPLYASGFEPTPGIFIPTFGGLFLLFSLFLPFVTIPLISNERKNGTLSVLTQLPFRFGTILITKTIASVMFVFFVLSLTIPSFVVWKFYGGHIAYGESFTLLLGYLLYGLVIVAISFCFATLFENTANAAILTIAMVVFSWVVDFAKSANTSAIALFLSEYTFTKTLKSFESGILSLRSSLFFIFVSIFFLGLGYIFLRFDLKHKWKYLFIIFAASVIPFLYFPKIVFNIDVTESHRNSFSPAVVKGLKQIPPLVIKVYLTPNDSRFKDYEHDFLKKLRLVKTDIKLEMVNDDTLNKNYGLFQYSLNGKIGSTYSNSEEEIFPIIFGLSGINIPNSKGNMFKGYPLVVDRKKLFTAHYLYYLIIPLIFILITVVRNFNLRRLKNETF